MATNVMITIKWKENLMCGVNVAKDPEHMTVLEKKHLPIISAPKSVKKGECFEVSVEVGKLMPHPNEPAHYIDFIELYADHTYLWRLDLTAQKTSPTVRTWTSLDHTHGKLRAFAHCNIHGTWESDAEIEVTG